MANRFPLRVTLASLAVATLASAGVSQSAASAPLAIVGVSVIDPAAASPSSDDQTIIIEGNRIVAVGPRATTPVSPNAIRLDGSGQFVIPGLWDSHVHFMNTGVTALSVLVAHGVTTVREMGGFIDSTRAWQARMRDGSLIGPRIITPGVILESPRYLQGVRDRSERLGGRLAPRVLPYRIGVADSADAYRAIDSLRKLNVDFVKIRTVASPRSFTAILQAAHAAGLRVAGHAPGVVSPRAAAEQGQDDIEHALGISTQSARDSTARAFVARGTWYTPTLVVSQAVTLSGDSANTLIFGPNAVQADPRRAYASPWLLGWWRMQVDERMADTSSAGAARRRQDFENSLLDVARFHAAGVRILAGTDAGSTLIYPGPSLHDELGLLVRAGLTPQGALLSATLTSAQFAKLEESLGRVAPGYIADLVVLDANPLENISNTRRIVSVIQDGRLLERSTLDSLLSDVRVRNATP